MGFPRVDAFDPDRAGQALLDDYAALVLASRAVDWPRVPQHSTAEMIIRRMATPNPGEGERLLHAAHIGDRMAGVMIVILPEDGQDVGVEITVHPEFRRRGTGTALLRTALDLLRQRGRATIEGWWIAADGVGEQWARKRGFRRTHATVVQNLSLPDADVSAAARAPAGYRTVEWVNHAPEELITSYAAARRAIEDAPLGEASFEAPDWTVERIRRIEAEQREIGVEQHVVVAVHEDSGEVVGFTEVELTPAGKDIAHQYDTAVLAAHRGHGLGLHIKARMAERLRAEHPEITRVTTSTGSDNTHMVRVNTALGYVVSHNLVVLTGDVDSIRISVDDASR